MSEQDTMRLVAELLDKTTGPLKDIQKSLRDTAGIAKSIHGDGARQVAAHNKSYRELRESLRHTREEIAGAFTPALAALGLTTFGVGETLGKMIEGLKALGDQYKVMRDLTRRTGASADFLESTANVIHNLTGQNTAAAIQSLGALREHMDRLTRLRPDELNKWNDAYTGLYESLGKKLVGKTLPQQLEEIIAWFDAHPDVAPDKKRDILGLVGLDPGLATLKLREWREEFEKELNYQKNHPVNSALSHELDDSFVSLDRSLRGLQWQLNETFGSGIVSTIRTIAALIEGVTKDINDFHDLWNGGPKEGSNFLPPDGHWINPKITEFFKRTPPSAKEQKDADDFAKALKKEGPGYSPISFNQGGSSQAETMLSNAVKVGMLAAFREWFASLTSKDGFQSASLTEGGGGSKRPGGAAGFGNSEFPNLGSQGTTPKGSGDVSGSVGGPGGDTSLTGNAFLQSQRQRFADELKRSPETRKELAAMLTLEGEGDPVPVVESLMNRMAMTGGSIHKGLHSRFYGPINRGQLPGAMAALERNSKRSAKMNAAIDAALGGSNLIKGATDQGMASDPNGRWPGGRVVRQQIFNDWGGGAGHDAARKFREDQQRQVNATLNPSQERLASSFNLLDQMKRSGLGGGQQTIKGDASLDIKLNGFPRGTKTDLTYGGLFTQYTLSRGQQMEASEQK